MPTKEDTDFIVEALRRRLVSQLQGHRARKDVELAEKRGVPRVISDALLARGAVTPDDVEDILDTLGLRIFTCRSCLAQRYVVSEFEGFANCEICEGVGKIQNSTIVPAIAPERDRLVGHELPPYRFLRRLGRRDGAHWYLAENMVESRVVTVKVLDARDGVPPEELVKRFLRSARTASRLKHPNIVRTYGAGPVEDLFVLETAHIKGRSLRRMLKRLGRIPADEASVIAGGVLKALDAAHAHNVIHRDVRPERIYVTSDGVVKLGDFVMLKDLSSPGEITAKGRHVGSARYAAPEQCAGGPVDARADLYSLGITLYEMVTGALPFDGDDSQEIAEMHNTVPLPDPRVADRTIPDGLADLISGLCAKLPDDRFPTASAALDMLRALWKRGDLSAVGLADLLASYKEAKERAKAAGE